MSKRRIIANCMHEHELAIANQLLTGGVTTEGTVVGEIEEADLLHETGISEAAG